MSNAGTPQLGVGAALSEDPEVRATYWRQEAVRLAEERRELFRKINQLQAEIAELRNPS